MSRNRSRDVGNRGPVAGALPGLELRRTGTACGFPLASLLLTGCATGVLDPAGPIASSERTLLINATTIMLLIVVPVIVATIAFAWWFRAGNRRAFYKPDWAYSGRIELVVWLVPLLIVLFLGGIGWMSAHALDPRKPIESSEQPIEVQVVSLDWKWLFIYPDFKVAAVNELVIPAGVPVHFHLTSHSVMNSFFIPRLGSQIYTMAGMETDLNLMSDKPGVFPGLSAQFSGDQFSDMRFSTIALSPAAFERWRRGMKATPRKLDVATFAALAARRSSSDVVRFGAVSDGLFNAIVMRQSLDAAHPQSTIAGH